MSAMMACPVILLWGAHLVTLLPNGRFSVWMVSISTRHTLVLTGISNIYKMASKDEENAFVPNQIRDFWQLCSSPVFIRNIEFSFRSYSASHYFLDITRLSMLCFLVITEILFELSDFRMCGGATAQVREMGVTWLLRTRKAHSNASKMTPHVTTYLLIGFLLAMY